MINETADALRIARDLPRRLHTFLATTKDFDQAVEVADLYDEFGGLFAESAGTYLEYAAWCRLAAGLLRGQDVPDSIYPPEDEDPADTARWKKWRVS